MNNDIIIFRDNKQQEKIWSNDLVKDEQVNFQGWLCGIGTESIDIRSNGDMYRGTCRVGGKIGHIDDEVWNLPTDFIECDKDSCTCVADLKSTRYKNKDIRKELKQKVKNNIMEMGGDEDSNNF